MSRFLNEIIEDESGLETIEWIGLAAIAAVVLTLVWKVFGGVKADLKEKTDALKTESTSQTGIITNFNY